MSGKSVLLRRTGGMPMPLDVTLRTKDGKEYRYYIPLEMMRGEKKGDRFYEDFKVMDDWSWTHPTYLLEVDVKIEDIEKIEIDVSQRLADVNREDNVYPRLMMPKGVDK
jgi:hypothetical protein